MTIKPLADNVVIKATVAEETTKSGIVLTSASKEKPQIAEVVAVGPGGLVDGKEVVMTVSVGDKVIAAGNVRYLVNLANSIVGEYIHILCRECLVCAIVIDNCKRFVARLKRITTISKVRSIITQNTQQRRHNIYLRSWLKTLSTQ